MLGHTSLSRDSSTASRDHCANFREPRAVLLRDGHLAVIQSTFFVRGLSLLNPLIVRP